MACYKATKEDAAIAALVQGWDANDVARLRGMWEEANEGKTFDVSDPRKAAKYLVDHRNTLLSKVMNTSAEHMTDSYLQLRDTYADNPEGRLDRVNMIATLFSRVLDSWQAAGETHSRTELCNGYTDDKGVSHGGQFKIFDIVYNQLKNQYSKFMQEGDDYSAAEIAKVLDNWGAFTAFTRITLRDTEGIKLGNRVEYADETNSSNFGENNISSLFDADESKREGWQEMNDFISAFGTIGKAVRRVLGGIQIYSSDLAREIAEEESKPYDANDGWMWDDLGFAKKLNPVTAHQALMEELRGVTSESDMLNRLQNSRLEWAPSLVKILQDNPQVRTQFFVDFSKDFQPYKEMKMTIEHGLTTVKTYIMNKVQNLLGGEYRARIKMGKTLSPSSVYSSNGKVNWQNVARVRGLVNEWFSQETTKVGALVSKKKSKFWDKTSWEDRANVVVDIAQSLGINLDATTATRLLKSKNGTKFTKQLEELFTHIDKNGNSVSTGFDALLSSDELTALTSGNFSGLEGKVESFKELFKKQTEAQKNLSKKGNIEEKVDKLLDLIAEERELTRMESRVTHKDRKGKSNTLFSNVNPSYLGTFIKTINSYAKAGDSKGLRAYLTTKFGDGKNFSSMFYYNGKFLNKWLEDLCNDDLAKDGSFAETLMYSRFLGSSEMDFENFTSKQHAIEMMHEYFFAENSTDAKGKKYAHYPVFILGDSGVAKYIKAKRYEAQEILDGLYNVYKSERRRMELTKAANKKLADKGFPKGIDNFSSKADEFTVLTFLNDPKVKEDIALRQSNGVSEETAVKDAIKNYMDNAVKNFQKELTALGVLEEVEAKMPKGQMAKVPKYFSKELAQSKYKGDMNRLLADYYWNTKFATIQQLQLMTVDPGFYKGTKDLQKRYKEIHAPGTPLSLEALDFEGKPYSEDGIERCIYFDDINVDARDTNPEFMQAIKDHLGEGSAWEAYCKNTLTDGQGYRTLDSYRKVMGMAGKWTKEMQNAYDKIKELRATYGENATIPAEELEKIASLSQVFMPIKPYMFTLENISTGKDILKVPVQHKYAEAVLIPELLPNGCMLKDLALAMEKHIDEDGKPAPIDLVGSTKIVKVGGFGATNLKGVKSLNDVRGALQSGYMHQLSYGDYRIQTNVPEHINGSQLFGTQLRKLIMAGIRLDSNDYASYVGGHQVNLGNGQMVNVNGRNLVNFYNSLIVANILDSYHQFEKEVSDPKLLANALQQAIINNGRESMDNLLAYSIDEDGNFKLPLCEGGLEHDASSMLLSIFKKKVNKQKIKGGSAVQVSAMGISGYEEDGGLKYVTQEYTAADGTTKQNILYAEVEVPWDLSVNINGKEVPLKFSDYCNADGTLIEKNGTPLIEQKFPGILNRIAYRIPTERDYSMINLRIKRFSQKTAGGTIKVPAQGTTIAGFDFDIDKLYFMMREYHVKKSAEQSLADAIFGQFTNSETADAMLSVTDLEEYDYTKSPIEQASHISDPEERAKVARALRNNMLIDLISQRLMDPETFSQRYTPGGFANDSFAARQMRELLYGDTNTFTTNGSVDFSKLEKQSKDGKDPEPNYDPTDPMTIVRYNQQNQVAGKLIGIFANQNTNHAFASLMSEFSLTKPISFCGHSYSDLLHAPAGVDTDLNIAECLSASVDAVKDPVLNFLNFNTVTADAGGMLARLGYSGLEIGLLFNQPIIKELCDYTFNNNVDVHTALSELKNYYLDLLQKQGGTTVFPTDAGYSASTLAKNIIEDRKQRESAKTAEELSWNTAKIQAQLNVLDLFEQINDAAGEVSQFVTSTKFTASNAVGSTFGDMYSQQIKVKNYILGLEGKEKKVTMRVTPAMASPINMSENYGMSDEDYINQLIGGGLGNPFAYEQAMYDMNRRATKLLGKYFPYDRPAYSETRDLAASLTKAQFLDADTINSIHSDMMVYMLAQQENSLFDGESQSNGLIFDGKRVTNREYYTKYFPERVMALLEDDPSYKEDFPIFKYMIPTENEAEELELRVQDVGGLTPIQKDAIRDSWTALMNEDPNLARDLFMYNYYKLGFGFSPRAFMHLAPVAVKESIMVDGITSYTQFVKDVLSGSRKGLNSAEFIKQYIRNHSDNRRFVYTARGEFGKLISRKAKPARGWLSSFEISVNEMGDNPSLLINGDPMTKGSKTAKSFMPCIAIPDGENTILYMAQSTSGGRFNIGEYGAMTYVRVGKLGTTNKSLNYQYGGQRVETNTPILAEDSKIEGSTTASNDPIVTPTTSIDREGIINEMLDDLINLQISTGELMAEDADKVKTKLKTDLLSESDASIIENANQVRQAVGKHLLDNTGKEIC